MVGTSWNKVRFSPKLLRLDSWTFALRPHKGWLCGFPLCHKGLSLVKPTSCLLRKLFSNQNLTCSQHHAREKKARRQALSEWFRRQSGLKPTQYEHVSVFRLTEFKSYFQNLTRLSFWLWVPTLAFSLDKGRVSTGVPSTNRGQKRETAVRRERRITK